MSDSFLYDPLGPRGRRKAHLATAVTLLLAVAVLALILQRLGSRGQLDPGRWAILADPSTGVPQTLGRALAATLKAAAVAMILALATGAALAMGRLSRVRGIRLGCGVLVEGFRGVPLLLLMLFAALGLPHLGIEMSLFAIVVASLVAYNSAVLCEIIRGGCWPWTKGRPRRRRRWASRTP
jgi:glutamate transport system permease protein